jgi:hypothetical protein
VPIVVEGEFVQEIGIAQITGVRVMIVTGAVARGVDRDRPTACPTWSCMPALILFFSFNREERSAFNPA